MNHIINLTLLAAIFFSTSLGAQNETPKERAYANKIIKRVDIALSHRGFTSIVKNNEIFFWKYSPISIEAKSKINVTIKGNGGIYITAFSSINNIKEKKVFFIKEEPEHDFAKSAMILLLPYYLGFEEKAGTAKKSIDQKKFHASFALGLYQTNDGERIFSKSSSDLILTQYIFAYDPLKYRKITGKRKLKPADFIDSRFSFSLNIKKRKFFEVLDEIDFRIDILEYGENRLSIYNGQRMRKLNGFFTSIEYYRPYTTTTKMLWNEDIYDDHIYLQFCYWEPIAFRYDMTLYNGEKTLFFSGKAGLGPGQNSSLATTNLSPEEEKSLNKIFVSNWYGLNDFNNRRHNYYYSLTFPLLFQLRSDKYFNSNLNLQYSFYFFQAIEDIKVHDFLNRINFNYGYYITESLTLGAGYEFWHIHSKENRREKNHNWHRIILKMEKAI